MRVKVTIGVQEPAKVGRAKLITEITQDNAEISVAYCGKNFNMFGENSLSVIATCTVEAFIPTLSQRYSVT